MIESQEQKSKKIIDNLKAYFKTGLNKAGEKVYFEVTFNDDLKNLLKDAIINETIQTNNLSLGIDDESGELKTKNLYYFKNDLTRINFYRNENKNEVFLTTAEHNKEFLNLYGVFNPVVLEDFKIYKIYIKDKKVLYSALDEIKPKKVLKDCFNEYWFFKDNNFKKYIESYEIHPTNKVLNKALKDEGFILKNLKKCCVCGEKTKIYNEIDNAYYCLKCLEDEYL